MSDLPRGTVTLLFTDIEGSTRLLHELGDAYVETLAEHRRLLRSAFQSHGGVEVDTQGDAFFYSFPRAQDALAAAQAAQQSLAGGPVRVRIGVHTGEPVVTAEGYVGVDVHKAARVMAAGHGGQTLVSESTRRLVDDRFPLRDLGPQRLKDLTAPERLYQLGDGEFPPLKTLNQTNLPVAASPLVGRERELEELVTLLRNGSRVVTVTGAGGSGKTRLALQAAAELVDEFDGGVFWIPLAGLGDPELVLPTIGQTLGLKGDPAVELAGRDVLLLLDNFEHLLGAAAQVSDLLAAAAGAKALVTSRAPLHIGGEHEYPLDPLRDDEAVAFFVDRVRGVGRQIEPDDVVRAICRRLDNLPLALELAAARAKLLAPPALLERLDQRLPLLTSGRRDAPERQRTLRSTIEWSYELLDAAAQALLARLAVFAGSFSYDAAEQIADADVEALANLVDLSLLKPVGDDRFLMLETIAEFALEQLERSGEAAAMRGRHADYFHSVARSANLMNEDEGEQLYDIVLPDRDNMRGAIEWARESGNVELGLRIAVALENYWATNSPVEGELIVSELLAAAPAGPSVLRARAIRTLGSTTYIRGEYERGTGYYEQALEEFRRSGDEQGIAIMLHRLAVEARRNGDAARTRELVEESARIAERLGGGRIQAQVLSMLGTLAFDDGDEARGFELLEESAQRSRDAGFTWWAGVVITGIGVRLRERGRLEEARLRLREAFELFRQINARQNAVFTLAELALVEAEDSKLDRAGLLWGAVEAEEGRGVVGGWEAARAEYASSLLAAPSEVFERARAEGSSLSLDEAAERSRPDVAATVTSLTGGGENRKNPA